MMIRGEIGAGPERPLIQRGLFSVGQVLEVHEDGTPSSLFPWLWRQIKAGFCRNTSKTTM